MTTINSIPEAIKRSVSHNEVVKVECTWGEQHAIWDAIDEASSAYEYTDTNDGSYDVYGETNGEESFRLKLVVA